MPIEQIQSTNFTQIIASLVTAGSAGYAIYSDLKRIGDQERIQKILNKLNMSPEHRYPDGEIGYLEVKGSVTETVAGFLSEGVSQRIFECPEGWTNSNGVFEKAAVRKSINDQAKEWDITDMGIKNLKVSVVFQELKTQKLGKIAMVFVSDGQHSPIRSNKIAVSISYLDSNS